MTKSQKTELNKLLHQACVLRDSGRCLRCGTSEKLQMSRIYPKGTHRKMEYDLDNVKTLCWNCHFNWWHKSPVEAWRWLEKTISKERLTRLDIRANTVDKSPQDFKLLKIYLQQEIKKYTL